MSTITTILLLVVIVALFNPDLVAQVRAALTGAAATAPGTGAAMGGLTVIFGILGAVAPDIALISGYVGDIVAGGLGKFRWSLTSILGIIAVILNKIIWGYMFGSDSTAEDLRGFGDALTAGRAAAAAATTTGDLTTDIAGGLAAIGAAAGSVVPAIAPGGGPGGGIAASPSVPGVWEANAGRGVSFAPRRGPGSVSTLGTEIRGALRGTRRSTPGPRAVSFGRPLGGITSSGRAVKPSAAARDTGAGVFPQAGGARYPESIQKSNPCVIRGLGALDTESSPMSSVVLSFVFIIYFLDMWWNQKRTRPELTGNFFFGVFVILVNAYALSVFSCYGSSGKDRAFAIAKALTVGLSFGGLIFVLYQNYGQQYLPVDASPASLSPDNGGGSGSGTNANLVPGGSTTNLPCPPAADGRSQTRINGICVPNTGLSQCGGPNADDQFVCDAYKNGKKLTTTIVQ